MEIIFSLEVTVDLYLRRLVCRELGRPNYRQGQMIVIEKWDLDLMETWLENYYDKNIIQYLKGVSIMNLMGIL